MKKKFTAQELLARYQAKCREISAWLYDHDMPSHGADYELECETLWRNCYADDYARALRPHVKRATFCEKTRRFIKNQFMVADDDIVDLVLDYPW